MNLYFQYAVVRFLSRVVVKISSNETLIVFRKVERLSKLAIKLRCDIGFLGTCIDNQLLPKFTDFKLFKDHLRFKKATTKFKLQLMKNEKKDKETELSKLRVELGKALLSLQRSVTDTRIKFHHELVLSICRSAFSV